MPLVRYVNAALLDWSLPPGSDPSARYVLPLRDYDFTTSNLQESGWPEVVQLRLEFDANIDRRIEIEL